MKRYMQPGLRVIDLEAEEMIAESPGVDGGGTTPGGDGGTEWEDQNPGTSSNPTSSRIWKDNDNWFRKN